MVETTYSYPGVRVPLPRGWSDESVITLVGPAKDGLAPNVVITRARLDGDDWRAAVDRELGLLKKEARGYRAIQRAEVSHRGAPALRVEHAFTSPDRVPIRQIQLYAFVAPWLFTVSVSHAEHAMEASRGELEQLLGAIELGGGAP